MVKFTMSNEARITVYLNIFEDRDYNIEGGVNAGGRVTLVVGTTKDKLKPKVKKLLTNEGFEIYTKYAYLDFPLYNGLIEKVFNERIEIRKEEIKEKLEALSKPVVKAKRSK